MRILRETFVPFDVPQTRKQHDVEIPSSWFDPNCGSRSVITRTVSVKGTVQTNDDGLTINSASEFGTCTWNHQKVLVVKPIGLSNWKAIDRR